MKTVTLGADRTVRIPEEATRRLRLRKGARLAVVVSGDSMVLTPASRIPPDQLYFYTDEWQAKEREADEAIAHGEVIGPFSDADEAIRALRSAKA